MSVFLDVSNFPGDNRPQKYKYYDEFERLIALNQGFINNNNNNNAANVPSCEEFLHSDKSNTEEGKLLNLVEDNVKPDGKCSNIGNFNVYNRCVFFINNSGGNGHLENKFKVNNSTARDADGERRGSLIRNDVRKSSANLREERPKGNRFKLLYLHKDSLRPILSPDIKPGIYRRLVNKEKDSESVPKKSESNVYMSYSEEKGKVLSSREFQDKYVKVGDECILKSKQTEFAVHYVHQLSDNILNDFIEDHPGSAPDEASDIGSNLNPPAYRMQSLPSSGKGVVIKRDSNEIVCKSSETGKNMVYKIIHPNLFELESLLSSKIDTNFHASSQTDATSTGGLNLQKIQRKAPYRKKLPKIDSAPNPTVISAVTRYGRISKPPKHVNTQCMPSISEEKEISSFQADNDEDFKYSREIVPDPHIVFDPNELRVKRNREIPPHYTCATCNKIYLGRRMQQHLEVNPTHNAHKNPKDKQNSGKLSLYKFLVEKIKETPEEHRTELFLTEITDLVNQLQLRSSRFVRNTSGVHFLNSQTSKILGIPEGHYSIDASAIDSAPETEPSIEDATQSLIAPPHPRLDYNLSISLDDTISDAKLNLSDNMIASEESLLRTVDDLVEQGMNNLREHDAPVMHYDHASDNAVEAASIKAEQPPPILDLSLDLFQFGSN